MRGVSGARWVGLLVLAGCGSNYKSADTGGVANRPPTVSLQSPPLGATYVTTDAVKLTVAVTDDHDSPEDLQVSVLSDQQGVVALPTPDSKGIATSDISLQAGVHELTVNVTDSDGAQSSTRTTIRILKASFPSQPVVRIEPGMAVTGDDLAAVIVQESVDPEGDSLAYVWSWTLNGADAGISSSIVPGAEVEAGQVWTVSVYAADSSTQSAAATAEVTIANGVPDPGVVSVTPSAPSPGNLLTCIYSFSPPRDPEGDSVSTSFSWTRNGVDLGVSASTLDSSGFARGDQVACAVVVDDGMNQVAIPSAAVTMGNTPPVGTFALISPSVATEASTLSCKGGGTDADGDPLTMTYLWFVNGVEKSVGATLDGGDFSKGDSVVCEAVPNDGTVDGSVAASSALAISNTPPGAPTVDFVRTDLVPGVSATCAVTVEASDVDGDLLSYRWSWEVNGTSNPESTDTLDTSGLSGGDVLTCLAVADDGTAVGTAAQATITLADPTLGSLVASDAVASVIGPSEGSGFGHLVDTVGDFDGDGLNDLLVTAPNADGANGGVVYLFGSSTLAAGGTFAASDSIYAWEGDAAGDGLGSGGGAADAGDVDGDGKADLMIAAPNEGSGGVGAGTVYLLYGGTRWSYGLGISNSVNARIRGSTSDALGTRLAADDFDGDGLSDVVMAAPTSNHGATAGGMLAVFNGDTKRYAGVYDVTSADSLVYGTTADSELGWTLATVGDPNNDGYPDLATSLIYDDTNGTDAGTAVVLSGARLTGNLSWLRASYLVVHGMAAGDHFGYDLGGPGDVDLDGVDDLLIAGNSADGAGTDSGELRLFFGATGINREVDASSAKVTFSGLAPGDSFGSVVEGVGDFDGDGRVDFLVGAPGANGTAGEASLFLGGSLSRWLTGDTSADVTVGGLLSGDTLGNDVSGWLDLDSDGYSDVVVGAEGASNGGLATGAIYLFEGP